MLTHQNEMSYIRNSYALRGIMRSGMSKLGGFLDLETKAQHELTSNFSIDKAFENSLSTHHEFRDTNTNYQRTGAYDWCSQVDGYIESHGGVQIPAEGSGGGVGKFCCWECAKSWNQQYTPVMQRWVRSMFIDDVAGYMVTYSKRKHVEKNLSQRG